MAARSASPPDCTIAFVADDARRPSASDAAAGLHICSGRRPLRDAGRCTRHGAVSIELLAFDACAAHLEQPTPAN